jgi:hypothetical protein
MNGIDITTYYKTVNGVIDNWILKKYGEKPECSRQTQGAAAELDIGYNVQIEPVTFTKEPEPTVYCYYSRGLLLANTEHMSLTTKDADNYYSFEVIAVHQDGRMGSDLKNVFVVDKPVLVVFLREVKTDPDLALLPLTSAYHEIVLEGRITENPDFAGAELTYRWEIFRKESGGTTEAPRWADETSTFTWNDADIIEWDSKDTRISFKVDTANSQTDPPSTELQKDSTYKIKLHVIAVITEGPFAEHSPYTGMAQIIMQTAPGPPQSTAEHGFEISPNEFIFPNSLLTDPVQTFAFLAPQWRSSPSAGLLNAELAYDFGIIPNTAVGSTGSGVVGATFFTIGQSASRFELTADRIPYDGGDKIMAIARVCSRYKVCATRTYDLTTTFNSDATYDDIDRLWSGICHMFS